MLTVDEIRRDQKVNYYRIIDEIESGRLRAIPFKAENGKTTYRIEESDYEAWKRLKKAMVNTASNQKPRLSLYEKGIQIRNKILAEG